MPNLTSSFKSLSFNQLAHHTGFIARHIGPDAAMQAAMLASIGATSLEDLSTQIVPKNITLTQGLALPDAQTEESALAQLAAMATKNVVQKSYIGLGYHETITPSVILRNVLENPGWYTAYTPYQAEIAQGRLEALLNYQQMVLDLTSMEIANASLLDEATAAAEAMAMAKRVSKSTSQAFFVDSGCLPQTIDVMKTRAAYFGFTLIIDELKHAADHDVFGALIQNPSATGEVRDLTELIQALHTKKAIVTVAADILSLALIKPAGEMGADIVVGSTQRFGVPMGFGGPHAAFFATRDAYKRAMPGRIIGVSVDARGKKALRMALQTREQHIRREKANSNICTSQVLLANIAGFYAVYHGPVGIRRIAQRVHAAACLLAQKLAETGMIFAHSVFFDTLTLKIGDKAEGIYQAALAAGYNLRQVDGQTLGVSLHEKTTTADLQQLYQVITGQVLPLAAFAENVPSVLEDGLIRQSAILSHPVFNRYHSETEMMRYLKRLENKDLALNHSMISLGSCTMKLNAASEMLPVTWRAFGDMHPFAPLNQAQGYMEMIQSLEAGLCAITGFDAICMQPNSGAQGEYAGLVCIQRYHLSRGDAGRTICLIPKSAHGTNPATAQMIGLQVVIVDCDAMGNVDVEDLRAKVNQYAAQLSCLMITYPSTHGVFEAAIAEICALVHAAGGQVYMDGANMNAQVGLTQPALIGADVSHMNLHKTFCIPHGGGGPGMGPIGLKAHLAPFMPNHSVQTIAGEHIGQSAVSAAPWGSASILPISWMYINMMGAEGLRQATQVALLNANYIAHALKEDYPLLYSDINGRVAHECIIDLRPIKAATGITEVDIAKRLMDYGFHAPTMSFPVAGTFMIEPTESENKAELDRFIAAMRAIRAEIRQVEAGGDANNNPLKNAPHTQNDVLCGEWQHPYSREQAVFPLDFVATNKFWPSVNRIDDVHGDRHLFCSCIPTDELA